jgi:predicted amidohydrolase
MIGMPYPAEEGLRNAYMYYHRDEYKMYYKVNLFPPMNEPDVYVPGTDVPVWNTDFGKIGVAICYDVRFPDLFQKLKASDAAYIFIPAAFPRVRIDQWRDLVLRRAKETAALVFAVNSVGDDGTNEFGGMSMVVDSDGAVLAEADQTSETTLDFDLAVEPAGS